MGSLFLVAFGFFAPFALAFAQEKRPTVYVAPIEGVIDLGLAPFVQRVLDEATQAGAAAVVLEINTFGGRVDAAVLIRDALLNSKLRTVAFVNTRAISAGALIALSAGNIVMAGGGTIGAATPVQMGQPGATAKPATEKTVSYVRKEFRATAESRKRTPFLAEATVDVDVDVEIPGVNEKGKLLTLTTEEALKLQETGLGAGHQYGSVPDSDRRWLGKRGRASSWLRLAGIVEIEGERVDVVSEGELIDAGQFVEVTRADGNRIVVRQVTNINAKE